MQKGKANGGTTTGYDIGRGLPDRTYIKGFWNGGTHPLEQFITTRKPGTGIDLKNRDMVFFAIFIFPFFHHFFHFFIFFSPGLVQGRGALSIFFELFF